jgi:hypothetical protein
MLIRMGLFVSLCARKPKRAIEGYLMFIEKEQSQQPLFCKGLQKTHTWNMLVTNSVIGKKRSLNLFYS